MSTNTPDEKPTETQPTKDAPKETPAAGPKDAKPAGETKTVDIVAAQRERLSRAKDAAAGVTETKSKEPTKAQDGADDKGAEKAPDLEAEDDEKGNGKDEEFTFDEKDLEDPGFYDGLTKEQWKVVEAKAPVAAKQYKAGQKAQNAIIKRALDKTTKPDQKKPQTAVAEEETDLSEAIDLLYDPKTRKQGLTKLLGNKESKELIRETLVDTLREEFGYQPELRPVAEGIALASKEYPLLNTDDDFFDEVDAFLKRDANRYDALMKATDPELIAAAIENAAAKVTRSRAAKKAPEEKKTVGAKERRENLERNTQAAKEQAGVKTGDGSRTTVTRAETGDTADLVRSIREQRGYTHLKGT